VRRVTLARANALNLGNLLDMEIDVKINVALDVQTCHVIIPRESVLRTVLAFMEHFVIGHAVPRVRRVDAIWNLGNAMHA